MQRIRLARRALATGLFAESLAGSPVHRVVDDQDVVTTGATGRDWVMCMSVSCTFFGHPRQPRRQVNLLRPPKPLADHAPINYVDRIS
jgi:hypothetical protein